MSTLERAIQIAASAHQRQFDKGGSPYFLHPLRVMLRLKSEPDRIVAGLHDVLEDTAWTPAQLVEEGFPPGVMTALDAVCRRKEDAYDDVIDRVRTSQLDIRANLADLDGNMGR